MKKAILLSTILTAGIISSCHDDLDFPTYGETPQEEFWQTSDDALSAVVACYGKLVDWPFFEPTTFALEEIASDNTAKGSTIDDQTSVNQVKNFTFTPSLSMFNSFWNSRYSAINVCNQAITNIPPIEMDETEKNQLLGEARFIRAWLYFELVRTFGEVIIYDGLPEGQEYNIAKSSIEDVYSFIAADLEFGIQNMKSDAWSDEWKGRVNSWSAKALLAKVKMYMASGSHFVDGPILNTTWNDVKDLTDDIIANGPYHLLTSQGNKSFYYLFRLDYENCEESIFEAQCGASKIAGNINRSPFAVYQWVRGESGWGFNVATDEMIASWKQRTDDSVRLQYSIIFRGQQLIDGDVVEGDTELAGTKAGQEGAEPARYNYKVYVPAGEQTNLSWIYGIEQNPRLLRFADILLIDAEAELNLGSESEALTSINKVRDRVKAASYTTLTMQQIWDERRFELAFENDRFFDLVRTGQAETILGDNGFVYPKHVFYPVPQEQIDLSGGILKQNTNY